MELNNCGIIRFEDSTFVISSTAILVIHFGYWNKIRIGYAFDLIEIQSEALVSVD
jgi:hypothetical protein